MAAQVQNSTGTGSHLKYGSAKIATVAMMAARTTGTPLPANSAYDHIQASNVAARNGNGKRFMRKKRIPASTATFPPLATTKCDNPLFLYES